MVLNELPVVNVIIFTVENVIIYTLHERRRTIKLYLQGTYFCRQLTFTWGVPQCTFSIQNIQNVWSMAICTELHGRGLCRLRGTCCTGKCTNVHTIQAQLAHCLYCTLLDVELTKNRLSVYFPCTWVYNVQFTVYSVHGTVYSVQCIVYSV